MKRRKMFTLFNVMLVTLLLVLTACGGSDAADNGGSSEGGVVNILNWSGYIPDDVIKQFEEETGITVNYSTVTSNEEMVAKLSVSNSGYDLAVPSTYFVEVLINEGSLEKIDKDNIPNLKNIGEEFLGWDFDPNDEYSLPFMWGSEIIAYDKEAVDMEIKSYRDLFDPSLERSLIILDDPRTMIGAMLEMLGYSPNSTNEAEIMEAGEELQKMLPNIVVFNSDNSKNLLVSGEVKAGVVYAAEAYLAKQENPNIELVIPEDHLSLWQDNFVIPKDAPNKENAERFINFIYEPEVSKEITMEYPYNNPNVEALKLLPDDIREAMEIPEEDLARGSHAVDVGEALQYFDRAWSLVKQ